MPERVETRWGTGLGERRGHCEWGGANHGEAGPPTEGEVDRRGRRRSFPGLGKVGIQGGTGAIWDER